MCDNGTTPVTWFQFATNASAQCPLLNITASDNGACEVAFYTSCSGNMNNNLEELSSMCFEDGTGLWAPSETFVIEANKTYYLRIKTASATSLEISAKSYSPGNNNCDGAISVDSSSLKDNNACHKPGQGFTPDQLCAFTIENTAYYQYYVASDGNSIFNIKNIACDNGNGNNSSGFQIGFFTGTCGSLTPLNCTSGSGTFVQATTPSLTEGTKVYVAIDGMAGSNCQYSITAINAYGVLANGFKNFSAWKNLSSNSITWTTTNSIALYYEVQRSSNGRDFSVIGKGSKINESGEKCDYVFEDTKPLQTNYYRIKQIKLNGDIALSEVIKLNNSMLSILKVTVVNPASNSLQAQIETNVSGNIEYSVTDMLGNIYIKEILACNKGITSFRRSLSNFPNGAYILKFIAFDVTVNKSIIKVDR